jgi:SAM-dependent methyltransferase
MAGSDGRASNGSAHIGYANEAYWDGYFRRLGEAGSDLDWQGRWTDPFIPLMHDSGSRDVLELGCGTGNDAARLAAEGFRIVAIDLSVEAIGRARKKYGDMVDFRVADMTTGLSYPAGSFDAVMANVSLHMFSDAITRAIFDDVRRVLRLGGLFLFHVNADDDRPLRERWRPVVRELQRDYVLEEAGQTIRFFSHDYLVDLLASWQVVTMDHLEIEHERTHEPFKRVWRVVARRPASGRESRSRAKLHAQDLDRCAKQACLGS